MNDVVRFLCVSCTLTCYVTHNARQQVFPNFLFRSQIDPIILAFFQLYKGALIAPVQPSQSPS